MDLQQFNAILIVALFVLHAFHVTRLNSVIALLQANASAIVPVVSKLDKDGSE